MNQDETQASLERWLLRTDRKEIDGMSIGQTWLHVNNEQRVKLEELSHDNTFWFVEATAKSYVIGKDGTKNFCGWGGHMKGNLGHKGNETITISELQDNYKLQEFK